MPLLLPVACVLGLVVGSFLNSVIIRKNLGETLGGRSYCRYCRNTLTIGDLIPVVSFVLHKGRCRYCSTVLSWQYPLVELLTAACFTGTVWILRIDTTSLFMDAQSFLQLLTVLISVSAGIIIFISDLRYQIIPNYAVIILVITAAASYFLIGHQEISAFIYSVISSSILASILAAIWLLSRGRFIGLGDAKLMFATSLLLGYPASIAAFLFSFWIGGISGIVLLALRKKSLGDQVPFGPFILTGTLLAYFFSKTFFNSTGLEEIL